MEVFVDASRIRRCQCPMGVRTEIPLSLCAQLCAQSCSFWVCLKHVRQNANMEEPHTAAVFNSVTDETAKLLPLGTWDHFNFPSPFLEGAYIL